jgi:hypothetical protein
MRMSDGRYDDDQQRHAIALRFLAHEARTRTIRVWTGLSDDRIRNLYKSYFVGAGYRVVRHRGQSPHQTAYFARTAKVRQEAVCLASLFLMLGLIKSTPASSPYRGELMPNLHRAGLMCQAFDTYIAMVRSPHISFEHAIFLATTLNRGGHLRLGTCLDCGGLLINDPISGRGGRCSQCSRTKG